MELLEYKTFIVQIIRYYLEKIEDQVKDTWWPKYLMSKLEILEAQDNIIV